MHYQQNNNFTYSDQPVSTERLAHTGPYEQYVNRIVYKSPSTAAHPCLCRRREADIVSVLDYIPRINHQATHTHTEQRLIKQADAHRTSRRKHTTWPMSSQLSESNTRTRGPSRLGRLRSATAPQRWLMGTVARAGCQQQQATTMITRRILVHLIDTRPPPTQIHFGLHLLTATCTQQCINTFVELCSTECD